MLDVLIANLLAWFSLTGQPKPKLKPLEVFAWENSAIFKLPSTQPDPLIARTINKYTQNLANQGVKAPSQGIWVQSNWLISSNSQGKKLLPAASLTKIATTLAALDMWGAKHQFQTKIYGTGEVIDGVLTGDLIIEGSGDPLFVWEEAISLGNTLNQLGISRVEGDLVLAGKFYMNFQSQPEKVGKLLRQGLDRQKWQSEATQQFLQMPPGTKQPVVEIASQPKTISKIPSAAKLLVVHRSLPLAEILRQMNIYSNNQMAQMLADLEGGADKIAQTAADIANFPPTEIELVNGSGLGEANRISPRAVCQMLIAIDRLLEAHSLDSANLFPTAGRDIVGTVQDRGLPVGTTVKTGTLDNVSALAGVIPTKDRGKVYFSIINYGRRLKYFRRQQDKLLNELVQPWQLADNDFNLAKKDWYLGDPLRNSTPSK